MNEIRPFLVIGSAIVAFLSFPPFPFGPLIFIALVPLLYAIEDLSRHQAFWQGFLWGVIFHLGLVYYIAWVTIPGMIATVLILSLIPATACWIYVHLLSENRGAAFVFVPSYFLMWNWLLTMSELNYPWTDLGYALAYSRRLIQAADIGGVYLVSLLVIAVNLLIYASSSPRVELGKKARAILRYGAVLIILAMFGYGHIRMLGESRPAQGKGLTVALLQGDMTKDVKWSPAFLQLNFDRYFELSRVAASNKPGFLIWPETAIPTYLAQEPLSMQKVVSLVDSLNIPLLTGVPYYKTVGPREYNYYNSAILIEPSKPGYQLYSKIHLVPMSERVPYASRLRFIKKLDLGWGDFSPGDSLTIFDLDGFRFGTLICFESAFPGFARQFVRNGSQFLVVITNDMWFGRTSLYQQHAMMAVFRAVENRVPVVRAANTGISLAVDKWGRILTRSGIFKKEYLIATIHPETSDSIYNKIGDIIPQCATGLSFLSIGLAFWGRKRYSKEVSC